MSLIDPKQWSRFFTVVIEWTGRTLIPATMIAP